MDLDRQKTTPSEPMRLRAFTLTELLVVLAISGIVLLGIFEGIGMARRLARQKTERIEKGLAIYGAYRCIAGFAAMSDSVALSGAVCTFFRNGERLRRLQTDSLLDGVQDLCIAGAMDKGRGIGADTLTLTVLRDDDNLEIWKFAIAENEAEAIRHDSEQ